MIPWYLFNDAIDCYPLSNYSFLFIILIRHSSKTLHLKTRLDLKTPPVSLKDLCLERLMVQDLLLGTQSRSFGSINS